MAQSDWHIFGGARCTDSSDSLRLGPMLAKVIDCHCVQVTILVCPHIQQSAL